MILSAIPFLIVGALAFFVFDLHRWEKRQKLRMDWLKSAIYRYESGAGARDREI